MVSDVTKLCVADAGLEIAFAGSMAVTRQNSVVLIGRSAVGMKPGLVDAFRIGAP